MNQRLTLLSGFALVAMAGAAQAGPCTSDIVATENQIAARLEAAAGAGPGAKEGVAATMNRQPTPRSIAEAEVKLGDIPQAKVDAVRAAMRRAQAADQAGDVAACASALAEARQALEK